MPENVFRWPYGGAGLGGGSGHRVLSDSTLTPSVSPGGRGSFETRSRLSKRRSSGFTLIELLVVISIIALLVSILLPSLSKARMMAKSVKCAANQKNVGTAMALHLLESKGKYPPSYVYPTNSYGAYQLRNQPDNHPDGYMHWSWYLYGKGEANAEAFQCPQMENGGAPRTNPGPDGENWEARQIDQNGDTSANPLEDKQAPRMALTANAAIIPRNKFTTELSEGPRVNVLVSDSEIKRPGSTILITEFNENWVGAGVQEGGGILSKSHRPVNPFYHIGSGTDEYAAAPRTPGFMYGPPEDRVNFGLAPYRVVRNATGLIEGSVGPETNVVGRHHSGGDKIMGGTANFLYVDGHVDRKTILDTMKHQEWGAKYYSITGRNEVLGVRE